MYPLRDHMDEPREEEVKNKSVMKYDWSSSPAWAKYAATDDSGESHWFDIKPTSFAGYWSHPNARKETIKMPYQDTLESRPQAYICDEET